MPTFGCHSCWFPPTIEEFNKKGGKWEDTPCATCKLSVEYYNIPTPGFYDSGDKKDDDDTGHSSHRVQEGFIAEEGVSQEQEEEDDLSWLDHDKDLQAAHRKVMQFENSKELRLIREIIEKQTLSMLGNVIVRMLKIAKTAPDVFEVAMKHILYPNMSYSEIGDSMSPRFTKQKVLYCLKHAVEELPELSSVFLTDTRFSGGKNAIETLASKCKRQASEEELKGVLYGNDESLKAMALEKVNKIIHDPTALKDSALDFNYYSEDETNLRVARLQERNKGRYLSGKTSIPQKEKAEEQQDA